MKFIIMGAYFGSLNPYWQIFGASLKPFPGKYIHTNFMRHFCPKSGHEQDQFWPIRGKLIHVNSMGTKA